MDMKVWLDDVRLAPIGWKHVLWPQEAIELLQKGKVTHISLDHDLGDDKRGTGYDVLLWIEEAVVVHGFVAPVMRVHSANVSAKQKMLSAINKIHQLSERDSSENYKGEKLMIGLHNHSDYSLLHSLISVEELVRNTVVLKQGAVALTDYNNLHGAIEFYECAIKHDVKPILGCDLTIIHDNEYGITTGQLVLLAENNQGWHNLIKLSSHACCNDSLCIDREVLLQHREGLIALSAGVNGNIEHCLQSGNIESAHEIALWYKNNLNRSSRTGSNFFIELTGSSCLNEKIKRHLIGLSQTLDIPLVASNNSHFLSSDDLEAFEVMLALRDDCSLEEVEHNFDERYCLKSFNEMQVQLRGLPEAIENTQKIAQRCNVDLNFGKYSFPTVQTAQGMGQSEYLCHLAHDGLNTRWDNILSTFPNVDRAEYEERLNYELGEINQAGDSSYFLILADIVQWSKKNKIPVGVGRGRSTGSLLLYCLCITDINPLEYGLLFELFFNLDDIPMPNVDIDFCMFRRGEVFDYVKRKYGEEKVALMPKFGAMDLKTLITDIGCVLDMDLDKVNMITKSIYDCGFRMPIRQAFVSDDMLASLHNKDDEVARLFNLGESLEGKHHDVGVNITGMVIAKEDLVKTVPLFIPKDTGYKFVQWDKGSSDKARLVKFNFLDMKTLTDIDLVSRLVSKLKGHENFDIKSIPMDDEKTLSMISEGNTQGVFQLGTEGMRELLTYLKPSCFEDLVASITLYRPGPIESGMLRNYVECKQGDQEVIYLLPQFEPILKETHGVILYHEQLMQIAKLIAGFDMIQAHLFCRDLVRNSGEFELFRVMFFEGAKKNGFLEVEELNGIFDWLKKCAGYKFSKAHAVYYALISYQESYLKANYPKEFISIMSSEYRAV